MKKINILIAAATVAALVLIATPVSAQVAAPNEIWMAESYCTDEMSARRLARAMVDRGAVGYGITIMSVDVQCYDVVVLNGTPAQVRILEKQWRIVTPDGQIVDFWTAVDTNGKLGWVWFFTEESI